MRKKLMEKRYDLTEGVIWKKLLFFASSLMLSAIGIVGAPVFLRLRNP
jgi:hypothetical protein